MDTFIYTDTTQASGAPVGWDDTYQRIVYRHMGVLTARVVTAAPPKTVWEAALGGTHQSLQTPRQIHFNRKSQVVSLTEFFDKPMYSSDMYCFPCLFKTCQNSLISHMYFLQSFCHFQTCQFPYQNLAKMFIDIIHALL